MASEVKRMRYFDGLFLKEEEFTLDQEYNLRQRRLHNHHLHGCGIVFGLEVEQNTTSSVTVRKGMAIDKFFDVDNAEFIGREIIVPEDVTVNVTGAADETLYLYVYYEESQADVVAELGGTEPIHWQESATFAVDNAPPDDTEENLILARIDLKSDTTIDAILFEENGESLRKILEPPTGETTVISTGGEGKNYVINTNAEENTDNWTDSTSATMTVTTTMVPLEVMAGTTSFRLNASNTVTADTDYVTVGLAPVDQEDTNQLMAVEFSYKGLANWSEGNLKVIVRDTSNDVDILPNPMLVPNGQGKYRGVFTSSDSTSYELRLVAGVTNQDFTLSLDSVRFAPYQTTVGAAISGWTPYDLQITGTSSAPSKATAPDIDEARWRRVGDSMEIVYTYRHTNGAGALPGNGIYLFSIPAGYTIDETKVSSGTDEMSGVVGASAAENTSHNSAGMVKVFDSTHLVIVPDSSADTSFAYNPVQHLNFSISNTTAGYSFRATVPIAEWQSDIIISESRTEYVYNNDPSPNDDSDSFSIGEIGAVIPPVTGTSANKRIRLSRVYRHVRLEFQPGGSGAWLAADSIGFQYHENAGASYGAKFLRVSDTEYDIRFYQGGANAGDGQTTWIAENSAGTRWRVVASDNPFFVESSDQRPVSAVGAWIDAGEIEFKGTGGNPTYGDVKYNRFHYRRVGDTMEFTGQFEMTSTGSAGGGEYYVELPGGLNADLSKVEIKDTYQGGTNFGPASVHRPGDTYSDGHIRFLDSRRFTFELLRYNNTAPEFGVSDWSFVNPQGMVIGFQGKVPIAEWTHDVVLRESLTEYVYNSDTGVGDDTGSFASGELGGAVPSIPGSYELATAVRKRVRLERPYKHVSLEFDENGQGVWTSSGRFNRMVVYNANNDTLQPYGAILEPVSGTNLEWDVVFYGHASQEDGRVEVTWATEASNGTRWRVVASDNPFFVEAIAPVEAGDVGPWTDAGAITIKSFNGTDPGVSSNVVFNNMRYRRLGDSMELTGSYRHDAAAANGSGTYCIELPEGLHARDFLYADGVISASNTVGTAQYHRGGIGGGTGATYMLDDRNFTFAFIESVAGNYSFFDSSTAPMSSGNINLSFRATIPIDEWTNSDLVLRENLTEYVYNSSTADANDTSSFAQGANGALVPPASGANKGYRVRFSREYKHVKLEVKPNDRAWIDVSSTEYHFHNANGNLNYGIWMLPTSSPMEWDVVFSGAGIHHPNVITQTWADEILAGTRWRVVGSDNPLFVESGDVVEAGDVGPWTDAGAMVIGATTADPNISNAVYNKISYRRVGESMEFVGQYRQPSGAGNGTGTFHIELPEGLHARDIAYASNEPLDGNNDIPGSSHGSNTWGSVTIHDSGGANGGAIGSIQFIDSRRFTFTQIDSGGGNWTTFNDTQFNFGDPTPFMFSFSGSVPIDEWTNSDLVLRENQTEYVYNSSALDANDTTSFETGQEGALIPPMSGAQKSVRIQFSREFRHVKLEVKPEGTVWMDVGSTNYKHHVVAGSNQGIYLRPVTGSPRQFDVTFSLGGHHIPEFNANHAWSTETAKGTRWRVVGSDNPLAVETPDIMQGNVIGPWTEMGPIKLRGTGGDPGLGATEYNYLKYRRVGESMEILGSYLQTGTGSQGSGDYYIEIPEGLRGINPGSSTTYGSASGSVGSSPVDLLGYAYLLDERKIGLIFNNETDIQPFNSGNYNISAAGWRISFQASIPIEEWSGGNNVVLAENEIEFVSNTNTDNLDDTVSFATGESGSLVPNVPANSGVVFIKKRCRVSRPYKHFRIEFNPNGNTFWTAEKFAPEYFEQGEPPVPFYYGAYIDPISETEFDVVFNGNARVSAPDGGGVAWAAEHANETTWRVVCSDNPALVESPEPQQGNVIGSWTNAGPIAFKGTTSNPSPGTTTIDKLQWRRVGGSMEIIGQYIQTAQGTQGNGTFYFEVPEGLHVVDPSPSTEFPAETTYGTAQISTLGKTGIGSLHVWDRTKLTLLTLDTGQTSSAFFGSGLWDFSTTDYLNISFQAMIPIDEWQGQEVVLAETPVEYVSNFDTADANDTTSFTGGESGSLVPSTPQHANFRTKRVRLSRVFRHVRVEVQPNGTGSWLAVGDSNYGSGGDDLGVFGIALNRVNDLDYDVTFQKSGVYGPGNSVGNSWATENANGTRWRVVAADNPLLVESPEPYQGNVVGPWTDLGPIPLKGTGGDPTFSTTAFNYLKYRRVGESMEIEGGYHCTAAGTPAGTGPYFIEIPQGLHAVDNGNFTDVHGRSTYGNAQGRWPTSNANMTGNAYLVNNRSLTFAFHTETTILGYRSENMNPVESGFIMSFQASIPIREWQSQDVVLSESRVEYAYNTSTANTDDFTNFMKGEEGGPVPIAASGSGGIHRRVQFSRKFKHYQVEFDRGNTGLFLPLGMDRRYHWDNASDGNTYGVHMGKISDTEYDLYFSLHGAEPGTSWAAENSAGTRWRVVGSDNPAMVQAPQADYLAASPGSPITTTGSGHWPALNNNSVLLQPGDWQLNGTCRFSNSGSSPSYTHMNTIWALENGTGSTTTPTDVSSIKLAGQTFRDAAPPTGSNGNIPASTVLVRVTVPTRVYLCMAGSYSGSNSTWFTTEIYAQRMA